MMSISPGFTGTLRSSIALRLYRGLTEPEYPSHDRTVLVTHCGRICIGKRKIKLSHVFAGQWVGIRGIEEKILQVYPAIGRLEITVPLPHNPRITVRLRTST